MGRLSNNEFNHLTNFLGYGEISAPVWFLGIEESTDNAEIIRRRISFQAVEDCKEAHEKLGITKHHEGDRTIQRTWAYLCRLMLILHNTDPRDTEAVRTYQAEQLGRKNGETFLGDLLPIPSKSNGDWDYENFLPQYSNRQDYETDILPKRISLWKTQIRTHRPRVVMCYGKKYWPTYKQLFPDAIFNGDSVVAHAEAGDQVFILTHFPTLSTMNNRYSEIANIMRKYYSPNPK
ncbi:hypothetical protein [Pulveribacter sp.]|uniref:hypothetical protein n=1 Tax=Pulveribacter sp. TaxID=2678893 RepID=UPI0028AD3DC7|nr:hypothetical protein [Pulveribacter sp.]